MSHITGVRRRPVPTSNAATATPDFPRWAIGSSSLINSRSQTKTEMVPNQIALQRKLSILESLRLRDGHDCTHIFNMTFPELNTKAIAFGEIHGIRNLVSSKIGLIEGLLQSGNSLFVGLERDFDQSIDIGLWIETGEISKKLRQRFLNPTVSSFLGDQFEFLSELSRLGRTYPKRLMVHCLDLSFSSQDKNEESWKIRSMLDEDLFDAAREHFLSSSFLS